MTLKFKHSGTFGDLIYGLPIVKYFGGGEFYLHLGQIDWVGMHYYGSQPAPFHQGRMNEADFSYMKPLIESQPYITRFDQLDRNTEITHNLDRFREIFVHHPGNYVDCYSTVFGITDPGKQANLRQSSWLSVPSSRKIKDKPIVINRTSRWIQRDQLNPQWTQWFNEGIGEKAVFVGLEEEHSAFERDTKIKLEFVPTNNMLELAEIISGADQFIGNQSMALSLAIGLGVSYSCEARRDLPLERNECFFPNQRRSRYF